MISENRALRSEWARTVAEMQALAADDFTFTPDDQAKFRELNQRAKDLRARIGVVEAAMGAPPQAGFEGPDYSETRDDREHREAFSNYLRLGVNQMPQEQRQLLEQRYRPRTELRDTTSAMTSGNLGGAYPGSAGGFFVPVGFVNDIERAMKYYGPMVDDGVCKIVPTDSGQPLPWPTVQDTAQVAEIVGEGAQVSEAEVSVGMVMLGAYKFSTKMVKVSQELMNDSAFSFESFLVETFAIRLGRGLNQYLTTGSGNLQPTGIITAALAGGNTLTAVGSYANDGVGGANTIGTDDLIALEHAVDPLYRRDPSCRYMMADSTLRLLKQLKDKWGRPLWLPAVSGSAPATINGYPYAVNPYMDPLQTHSSSPAVTRNVCLFGPTSKYIVRKVRDLSVLRLGERYAEYGVTAFIAFARYDGNLVVASGSTPLAVLQATY